MNAEQIEEWSLCGCRVSSAHRVGQRGGESVSGLAARLGVTKPRFVCGDGAIGARDSMGCDQAAYGPPAADYLGQGTGGSQRDAAQAQGGDHWSARRLASRLGCRRHVIASGRSMGSAAPGRNFQVQLRPAVRRKLAISSSSTWTRRSARWCCAWMKSRRFRRLTAPSGVAMWPGLPARMTHDYLRHGTTSLFAALEVASGKVHGRCYRRHRHVEFIVF